MMNARVKGCRLVVRFVCELSWVWYGGARVVEVFGVWWISVVFASIACLGGRRGSSFCQSDCGG